MTPKSASLAVGDVDEGDRLDVELVAGRSPRERLAAPRVRRVTTVSCGERQARPQAARPCAGCDAVEQTSRARSIAATSAWSAGQVVDRRASRSRCTDRPPVSPRQISSVTSGSSGATTRRDRLEGRVERVEGRRARLVGLAAPEPVARAPDVPVRQHVEEARASCRRRRRSRRRPAARLHRRRRTRAAWRAGSGRARRSRRSTTCAS